MISFLVSVILYGNGGVKDGLMDGFISRLVKILISVSLLILNVLFFKNNCVYQAEIHGFFMSRKATDGL